MTKTDNGKYFINYTPDVLASQKKLLLFLEENGFEVNGRRILTEKALGVPVTIMLLLMKDALGKINLIQLELEKLKSDEQLLTSLELKEKYSCNVESSYHGNWTVYDSSVIFPEAVTASGSTQVWPARVMLPNEHYVGNLADVVTDTPKLIKIDDNSIIVKKDTHKSTNTIEILLEIFKFVEFSYAIGQRIIKERNTFKKLTGLKIKKKPDGSMLSKVQMIRKGLIHDGSIQLEYSLLKSKFVHRGIEIEDVFRLAFNESIDVIDNLYIEMLANIK